MQMEVSNGMMPLGFGGSGYNEQDHGTMQAVHNPTADADELDDSDNNVNNISNAARFYNDQVRRIRNACIHTYMHTVYYTTERLARANFYVHSINHYSIRCLMRGTISSGIWTLKCMINWYTEGRMYIIISAISKNYELIVHTSYIYMHIHI